MAFWGRHGHLGTVEAATLTLREIANDVTWDDLRRADAFDRDHNPTVSQEEWYMAHRLVRQIEGLQMVLWLNNAPLPNTWLPQYFHPENHAMYRRMIEDGKLKPMEGRHENKAAKPVLDGLQSPTRGAT